MIEFINEDHQHNYAKIFARWPQVSSSTEYRAAGYILALPIIYDKVGSHLNELEYPTSWIYDYLHPEDENEEKKYDLTGSMIQLGKLSLHLWNSYQDFHLLNCLAPLDDSSYKAAIRAINIRMNRL